MKSPPCKTCEERRHGCHGKCNRYAEWKADVDAMTKTKITQNLADCFITSGYMKSKSDWIKSHK